MSLTSMISRHRRIAAAVVAAGLALTGCSGSDDASPSASATDVVTSESASVDASASTSASASASAATSPTFALAADLSAVSVSDSATDPVVTVKAPWGITKTQTKVLKAGTGATVKDTDTVKINYVGVNGTNGEVFDSSFGEDGAPVEMSLAQVIPGFKTGLTGQKIGSRVLLGIAPGDGYTGGSGAQAGIADTDTLLFVVDLLEIPLTEATGAAVTPAANLPAVKFVDGAPEIAKPSGTEPADVIVQPLIKGSGTDKVAETSTVKLQYRAWDWATGEMVMDAWGNPQSGPLSGAIEGWVEGLNGQTEGSRVMLVVPPSKGLVNDLATPKVSADSTLVFLIDVLDVTNA